MKENYAIRHILLADDDQDHIILFKKILHTEFPDVSIASVNDGEALTHYLHLHPVDLLFLDLHMPCQSGHECLQLIRKDPAVMDLPIIVYSSSAQLSDIQKSFVNRADFYLVKPFHSDHLAKALKMILSVNWKDDPPIRQHYFINNRFVPYTSDL